MYRKTKHSKKVGFFAFIFVFILVVVLAMVMRVVVAFLQLKHKVRSAFGGGGGRNDGSVGGEEPQRQKVYDKSVGEYVKFEEIVDDSAADQPIREVEYREESQISDVEFEEIRD